MYFIYIDFVPFTIPTFFVVVAFIEEQSFGAHKSMYFIYMSLCPSPFQLSFVVVASLKNKVLVFYTNFSSRPLCPTTTLKPSHPSPQMAFLQCL